MRGTKTKFYIVACSLIVAPIAHADLTITSAGALEGLSLSTFVTGFSTANGVGPLGLGFAGGKVYISDYPGKLHIFNSDSDGQTVGSETQISYGQENSVQIATLGNSLYMGQRGSLNDVVKLKLDGTIDSMVVGGVSYCTGLVANNQNGKLYASGVNNGPIWEIDPSNNTKTAFSNTSADGVSVSPDGKILYAASGNGHVYGFDTQTKAQVFDSGAISGGIDGTAAGTGTFSNSLFVNTNSGTLWEINLTTLSQTLIATNGSRGDFVTVDPLNDTLLITQTDRIIRLNGGHFTTPEPSSVLAIGVGIAFAARRRKKQGHSRR